MHNKLYICAGAGGHAAQAKVLHESVTAIRGAQLLREGVFWLPSVSGWTKRGGFFRIWGNTALFFRFLLMLPLFPFMFRDARFIFFGPATCIPLMACCYVFGCPATYVESWSRFNSFSLSYKIARFFSFALVVQNSSLSDDDNHYFGRLG